MNVFDNQVIALLQELARREPGDAASRRKSFQDRFLAVDPRWIEAIFPPLIFEAAFLDKVSADAASVLAILGSLPQRIFGGDVALMLEFQRADATARSLVMMFSEAAWVERALQFARPDVLICESGIRIVEMNVGSALGGLGDCDRVMAEWQSSELCQLLGQSGLRTSCAGMMEQWAKVVREDMKASSWSRRPQLFIALVNAQELRAKKPSTAAFLECLEQQGFDAVTGLLQDLRASPTGISYLGRRIDAVYPMFNLEELAKHPIPASKFEQLLAADEAGTARYFGSPASTLFENKCNLELLTGPSYSHFFTPGERQLLERIIPLTLRLTPEVVQLAHAGQSRFVLKPASSFGGDRVMVGADVSASQWKLAVSTAAENPCAYVLQESAGRPLRYPSSNGLGQSTVSLGPMLLGGQAGGCLLREVDLDSGTPVINASRGARVGVAMVAAADQPR